MRNGLGLAAAALFAAGCGGGNEGDLVAKSERHGEGAVCSGCRVAGAGKLGVAEAAEWAVNATPASGPGFGGVGVAATGSVRFQSVPMPAEGGLNLAGAVDTIVRCSRTNGTASADLLGTLTPSGARFFLHVEDGDAPGSDVLALSIQSSPGGSFVQQIDGLDVDLGPCEPL